ncbi:hypothetical protein GCM10009624_35840 [Gordonia sinesedis]
MNYFQPAAGPCGTAWPDRPRRHRRLTRVASVSLDWYLVPATYTDADAAFALVESVEESEAEPSEAAEDLAEALTEPYDDITDSPYTSFPLDVVGEVVFVNVDPRAAGEAYRVVAAAAIEHSYHLLDPQLETLSTAPEMRAELAATDATAHTADKTARRRWGWPFGR